MAGWGGESGDDSRIDDREHGGDLGEQRGIAGVGEPGGYGLHGSGDGDR